MPTTPQVTTLPAQPIAFIHVTCKTSDIQKVMGPGIGELMTTVAGQGVRITGPWFTHHLRRPSDTFDFEIAVAVAGVVIAAGRVKPGERPEMKVAHTTHVGSYDGLGKAWGDFMKWIAAEGVTCGDDLFESYPVGPDAVRDPAQYRTELFKPITG